MKVFAALRAVVRAGSRPFAWVARARGWRWRVLVLTECLVAVVAGVALWWATGRLDLPDLPGNSEPFDAEAFQNARLDPKSNAYTVWRRALGRPDGPPALFAPGAKWRLNSADPRDLAWLKANREALAVFLEGVERPDAQAFPYIPLVPGARRAGNEVKTATLGNLAMLALEEVNRRAYRGDMEGSWIHLRAGFRAARLIARHGALSERTFAGVLRTESLRRLGAWADDPRTTPALLRRAINDLVALESLAPDDSVPVKADYVQEKKSFDARSRNAWTQHNSIFPPGPDDWRILRVIEGALFPIRRARAVEPERSRRLLKQLTANWLTYFALPLEAREAPAARVSYRTSWRTFGIDLFHPGPKARLAPPLVLAKSFSRSYDARLSLVSFWTEFKIVRRKERADHCIALITVAEALYRRDHGGESPITPETLVGPYLKTLPDDGADAPEAAGPETVEIEGVF